MSPSLIPSEALEGLMIKAFVEKTMASGLFWDAFLKADVYIPLADRDETPEGVEEIGDEIPVRLGVDARGQNVLWMFTSIESLHAYIEMEIPVRSLPAPEFLTDIVETSHPVVLIGPDGITLGLHPDFIRALAEGKVPESQEDMVRQVPKEANVFVGVPSEETGPIEKCLTGLFQTLPAVVEARFVQVSDDEGGSRLLLGLKLEKEDREELKKVAQAVAKAAEGVLENGKTFDITLVNGSLKEAFDKYGKVFFKKTL